MCEGLSLGCPCCCSCGSAQLSLGQGRLQAQQLVNMKYYVDDIEILYQYVGNIVVITIVIIVCKCQYQ